MYKTFQVGAFRAIEPEAIRAQDGDSGINMAVTYSIGSGKQQSSEFSLYHEGKVLYMIYKKKTTLKSLIDIVFVQCLQRSMADASTLTTALEFCQC